MRVHRHRQGELSCATLGWRATFTIGYVITGAGAVMLAIPPKLIDRYAHRMAEKWDD